MNIETARDFGYQTELLYPPVRLTEQALKDFAYQLDRRGVSYNQSRYADNGLELVQSSTSSAELSRYVVKPDRLVVVHENVERLGFEIFCEKVEIIAKMCMEAFHLPFFLSQVHVIRKIVNPAGTPDARLYLLDHVCGFGEDRRKAFRRPVHGVGLRFVFPVVSNDDPYEFDVKVESFLRDGRLLFIENIGRFHPPVVANNLAALRAGLEKTNAFLLDQIAAFFAQFHRPPEGGGPA
jgi:hypothetical protein